MWRQAEVKNLAEKKMFLEFEEEEFPVFLRVKKRRKNLINRSA